MRYKGFTLVELVVVIVLLGTFAAVLLPRFLDVTDDARIAHAQASAGSFASSMVNYRAAWLAKGEPSTLDLNGKIVTFTNGWPDAASTDLFLLNPATGHAELFLEGAGLFDGVTRNLDAVSLAPRDAIPVPEPGRLLLLGFGVAGLLLIGRQRIRA